jgi:hypothetical protein
MSEANLYTAFVILGGLSAFAIAVAIIGAREASRMAGELAVAKSNIQYLSKMFEEERHQRRDLQAAGTELARRVNMLANHFDLVWHAPEPSWAGGRYSPPNAIHPGDVAGS